MLVRIDFILRISFSGEFGFRESLPKLIELRCRCGLGVEELQYFAARHFRVFFKSLNLLDLIVLLDLVVLVILSFVGIIE